MAVKNATPAPTTGSTFEEERGLVSRCVHLSSPKKTWYDRCPPPYAIMFISALELIAYLTASNKSHQLFRYDPNNQLQLWRFITYMFLHNNVCHIILNIFIQCLFAISLEKHQRSWRVCVLYFGGGAFGALGAGCVRPDLVVGASAGVYALLISHLSHILLNFHSVKYKLWCFISVSVIVLSDILYNFLHVRNISDPIISEGAHVAGAISGLLIGLIIYRSDDKNIKNPPARTRILFWTSLIFFIILILTLLILNFQIKKCTPTNREHYSYTC